MPLLKIAHCYVGTKSGKISKSCHDRLSKGEISYLAFIEGNGNRLKLSPIDLAVPEPHFCYQK